MMRTFADECAAAIRQEVFYANMHLNSAMSLLGDKNGIPLGRDGLADLRQSLKSVEYVREKLSTLLAASESEQSRAA